MSPTNEGSSWDNRIAELAAHRAKTGTLDVSNKQLRNWMCRQRSNFHRGKLSREKEKKLEDIGFDFSAQRSERNEMIQHLQEYKSQFGNLLVPHSYKIESGVNTINLGSWVNGTRQMHSKGTINDDLKQALDSMGFVWKAGASPHNPDDMIQHLQVYKSQFGNLLVPFNYKIQTCDRTISLGYWVSNARQRHNKGKVTAELKQTLDSMGFVWNVNNNPNDMIQHLQDYKSQFGNLLVPGHYKIHSHGKTINLGTWVRNARQRHNKGEINEELKQTLDSIGFVWDAHEGSKDEMIQHLQEYKSQFGNVLVPYNYKIESCGETINLGMWVARARQKYRKGEMKDELKQSLDSIGFVWTAGVHAYNPDDMIQHLLEYKSQFGNLLVPSRYKIHSHGKTINLGRWVNHARQKHKRGKMNEDLKQTLDSMGFVWDARACAEQRGGFKRRKSYDQQNQQEIESITDGSTDNNSHGHNPSHSGEDSTLPASDDIDSPSLFQTPEPKRTRTFWRPPTPYPASDDEEVW